MEEKKSESLGICILGCGHIAHAHAKAIKKLGKNIRLYFASRSEQRALEYCRKYKADGSFGSYEDALKSSDVDIILIATPNNLHLEHARLAFAAGKHTVIEKPMCVNKEEADQIIRFGQQAGKHLMVSENHRFRPSVIAVESLIKKGVIGIPKLIRMNIIRHRLFKDNEWRMDKNSMGGGPLLDGGIHWVNVLLTYGGGATDIYAIESPKTNPTMPREDSISVVARLQNGAVGQLNYSWGIPGTPPLGFYSVQGSAGTIYVANNGLFARIKTKDLKGYRLFLRDLNGFFAMWKDFIESIKNNRPSLMSGQIGARDVAFVDACYKSAETGNLVKLT